jgi:CBS domain-containing protein
MLRIVYFICLECLMETDSTAKAHQVMTHNLICCLPTDTAQHVAALLRDNDIGAIPVVKDHFSRKLVGIITDRDLCCAVVAAGLEAKALVIRPMLSRNPIQCHLEDDLEKCMEAMERYQVRRLPIVDGEGRCVGIISQADLALRAKPAAVSRVVTSISQIRKQSTSAA